MIGALRQLEAQWNAEHKRHRYFEDLVHPLNLNVGRIEGGDWNSMVPAWCVVHCRLAMYPGVSAEAVKIAVEDCVGVHAARTPALANNAPEVRWTGFFAEGFVLEPDSDAELIIAEAHARVFGAPLASFTTPANLDARVTMLYDKTPTLVYGPTSRNIHGIDEAVDLASVKRITKTITLFVAEWCGVEPLSA